MNSHRSKSVFLALSLGAGLVACGGTGAAATPKPGQVTTGTVSCIYNNEKANPYSAECTASTEDARLSGSYHLVYNQAPSADPGGRLTAWGLYKLANDGGDWTCSVAAAFDINHNFLTLDTACAGEGGYTGLAAYEHATSPDARTSGLLAWVEPASD